MSLSTNTYFFIAGILCFLLGIAHSVIGELLIFHPLTTRKIPVKENTLFQKKFRGIIWATWHLASIFGLAFGYILIKISSDDIDLSPSLIDNLILPIMLATGLSSFLVLFSTKGRHPGWVVLLLIAVLIFLGQ